MKRVVRNLKDSLKIAEEAGINLNDIFEKKR
jgi:hypothetical protein